MPVSDMEAAWALRTRAIRALCKEYYPAHELEAWASAPIPRDFALVIRRRTFLAAYVETQLVGFGFLTGGKDELEALFVDPAFTRQGLARQLLSALEAEAARAGVQSIQVCASLNAVGFYLRAGYDVLKGFRFCHPAGFELDCIRMVHTLG